MDEAEIEAV